MKNAQPIPDVQGPPRKPMPVQKARGASVHAEVRNAESISQPVSLSDRMRQLHGLDFVQGKQSDWRMFIV